MKQFGSWQEAVKALNDVIGNINAHSESSPIHSESNDKMIEGIRLGIAEIERRWACEIEAMDAYYDKLEEKRQHLEGDCLNWEETDLPY